jgi:nucleoside-diphosphate-sugar epimerase
MKTVLLTGSQGFIGSYLSSELLKRGYKVIGIDNYSKYGHLKRPHDDHKNFKLLVLDLKDSIPDDLIPEKIDCIIACAAMIGGIAYFHKYAYDLIAANERIIANTYDFAIKRKPERVVVLSSSMVFESTTKFPSKEEDVKNIPPPISSYGFQKLSTEYFAKAAYDQYGIPYTIVRPFNCVGIGEDKAIQEEAVYHGNIEIMMSHVLPDLVFKVLSNQYPVTILGSGNQRRSYTNGKDIATGIVKAMESEIAINNDYNIASDENLSVKELLEIIWHEIKGDVELKIKHLPPYPHDVQYRLPCTEKAKKDLGFEPTITIKESIKEVIEWMKKEYKRDHVIL